MLTGKTGKESLDKLGAFPDIDLILMDVMLKIWLDPQLAAPRTSDT